MNIKPNQSFKLGSFSLSTHENVEQKVKELRELLPPYSGLFEVIQHSLILDSGKKDAIRKSLDFFTEAITQGGSFVFISVIKLISYFKVIGNLPKAVNLIRFIQGN